MESVQDRYEIIRALGEGGSGQVFLARDRKLDRQVALKQIRQHWVQQADRVAELEREAKLAALLEHPGIAHLYDLVQEPRGTFLVMEYVPGESLAQRLSRGALSPEETLAIGRKVGAALQHARGAHLDARADVYGLAATLYACLTGESPRVIRESRIPRPQRPALLKAIAEQPALRYLSVGKFLQALGSGKPNRLLRFTVRALLPSLAAALLAKLIIQLASPGDGKNSPSHPTPAPTRTREAPAPHERVDVPVVSAEAPAPTTDKAELEELSVRKTVNGKACVFGWVKNLSDAPIVKSRVEIEFFDEAGKMVSEGFGYTELDLIEPGSRSPVLVLLSSYPEGGFLHGLTIDIEPLYLHAKRNPKLAALEQKYETDALGQSTIRLSIRNDDKAPVQFVKATAVLYGPAGEIIGISSGYTAKKTLGPGEQSQVQILVHIPEKAPLSRYELVLDGMVN